MLYLVLHLQDIHTHARTESLRNYFAVHKRDIFIILTRKKVFIIISEALTE